jgi:nucleotide-binding universal stress UspA family protein
VYQKILAPLDGSSLAECVLPHLVSLSEGLDSEVILVNVIESPPRINDGPVDPLVWEMEKVESGAYLNEVRTRVENAGIARVSTEVLQGRPAQSILDYIDNNQINLVVLSSHGETGLSRWNVSGVVRKVVQGAKRSTMIVPAYKAEEKSPLKGAEYKKIFVPLDGSQRAEYALSVAVTLTRYHQAEMIIGHIIERPELSCRGPLSDEDRQMVDQFVARSTELSEQYLEGIKTRISADFRTVLGVDEDISEALHSMVEKQNINLVVLSAHGYSGKAKWPYGSITTSFIEYSTRPLLVVQDLAPEEIEPSEAELVARETKGH